MINAQREDLSKFLVHLTKDTDDGEDAIKNLINILKTKVIEARNPHGLCKHLITKFIDKNSQHLFNAVCFTEVPLPQIKHLTIFNNKKIIQLKPFGIVFTKDLLMKKGANQAIYINNVDRTPLKDFLTNNFKNTFLKSQRPIKKSNKFINNKIIYNSPLYRDLIRFYSFINMVEENNDFSWEREWRIVGNVNFNFNEIIAIIAENPDRFKKICKNKIGDKDIIRDIQYTPIISPDWDYKLLKKCL